MKELRKTTNLKYILTRTLFAAIAVTLITFTNTLAQEEDENGQVIDKIVAKVDDFVILKSDVEKTYMDLLSRGVVQNEYQKCQIVESLITQKMMLAQAEIDSVIVLDLEVAFESDRRMQYFMQQFGGSEEEMEAYYGKPLEQIQAEIADDLKEQLTVNRMREQLTADVTVTPSEIRKFFNNIPKDSLPLFSEEVIVAQIVRNPEVSEEQKEITRRKLLDIKSQVLNGADFGQLALQHSEDPGSASNGGEYPNFIKRGEFVPPFEAAAFSLKINEMSEPVETDYGFHLIQLLDRRGNEYKVRHILISPLVTQDDIDNMKQELDSVRNVILNDNVPFEQIAKEYSDEKLTGQNGGYYTDASGSDRMPVDQLDPSIFFELENMEVGTISESKEFKMPTGKTAVRIIFFKDEFAPHKANLKDDWQKIQEAALGEKKQNAESEWVEESMGNFFILVDPEFDLCNILSKK